MTKNILRVFYFIAISGVVISLFIIPLSFANDLISQERQVELDNLLEQDCGSCHGSLLKGGLGPSLLPEALTGKSAEFLKITILNGRENTAMPPWKPLLSEADVDWLATRLLHPAQQPEVEK